MYGIKRVAAVVLLVVLAGCSQKYTTLKFQVINLASTELEKHGLAFITPSTITGQEEEKQTVALVFTEELASIRPDIRCITLPMTLGLINKSDLFEDYKQMYSDYKNTGLFDHENLRKIGKITQTRYLAQLKLQGFQQGEKERFGGGGFRILETKYGSVRLFLQIWDTTNGSIAWEGVEELRISSETLLEKPVTLTRLMEQAAKDLIAKLP